MIASYHTHTYRCRHAFGTEEEYIEKAIAEGVEILGFSDHAPMPYKNGYVSNYKMTPQEIGEYFESLISLREKYKDKIEIKIGFETEYYPSLWESSLALWRKFPIDFLILGQHFVPEERGDGCVHTLMATENKDVVICYVDQIIAGMRSGVISCVAHPDIINYVGEDTEFFVKEMQRLILEAIRLGIPLEYNLLGMSDGRTYPKDFFWREAARLGAAAVIGCDSHSPERVAKADEVKKAEEYLVNLGVNVLKKIELKKVLL